MFLKLEKRSSKFKINEKLTICMENNNIKYKKTMKEDYVDPSPTTYTSTLNFDKLQLFVCLFGLRAGIRSLTVSPRVLIHP